MEIVTDFIFFGSKITVNGNCSHEIKTLAPWKEGYDKPRQHIKEQKHNFDDIDLYSQSYGFPVLMYGCESWIIKKAEPQRINSFEL